MTAAKSQGLLAYRLNVQQDYVGAGRQVEIGLLWAGRIESGHDRADTEAQLLTLSGMVAFQLCRFDEARETLLAVVSRGEALGSPHLQLAALDNLAVAADLLGRWDEMAGWAERMRTLAHSIGALSHLGRAQHLAAAAAEGSGNFATAIQRHEQALAIFRTIAYRRMEALTLQRLGASHLEQGDGHAALQWQAQAQAIYKTLDLPVEACETSAYAALATVNRQLDCLGGELAETPAAEMILLRWLCQQVLQAVGDARAEAMLEQLHADVQARAAELTDAADRDRLIQALPAFRAIVAAFSRRGPPGATA